MGLAAAIIGSLSAICVALGIVDVLNVDIGLGYEFTWQFWFTGAVILLLASIAFSVGRRGGGGDEYD
jgi:hypothetical protein